MAYNFSKIRAVPNAEDLVASVMEEVRKQKAGESNDICRTRPLSMVARSGTSLCDRLSKVLEDFPILDELHPFYADLMNTLYDRERYQRSLRTVEDSRQSIARLSKHYVHLLKQCDSPHQCGLLTRAALGRMCTVVKRQETTFIYLEQVRQHLSRLPSIDPNCRSIVLCGYPNVGKSSFLNKITDGDARVQPYAFTTLSLFAAPTDFKYVRWQVIDTPGLLDHPLEERNTIEMQAIPALAHLRAAVIFIVDLSEECGYSLQEQLGLFSNLKPLFARKPLVVAANKVDTVRLKDLDADKMALISKLETENNLKVAEMSTVTGEGIVAVKEKACMDLLQRQVQQKKRAGMNRLHVAVPMPREATPCVPDAGAEDDSCRIEAVAASTDDCESNAIDMSDFDDDNNDDDDAIDQEVDQLLAQFEW